MLAQSSKIALITGQLIRDVISEEVIRQLKKEQRVYDE